MNIPNGTFSRFDHFNSSSDTSLFSSSVPLLQPHQNLKPSENYHDFASDLNRFGDCDLRSIGDMLPDDEEELFAGLMDDLNLSALPATLDDEYDLFGSGGGLEMESDSRMGNIDNGVSQNMFQNGVGSIAGEHPSRTLFVRNINSNVEDLELKFLFEQFGDIRTLYTACKHRGFVMISYYDIRASRAAMRALQSKLLKRRKLDIHFSIPKDNPSEKDVNQGTLVVFNLAPSVTNKDLENIFGAYGEIKEIRETPNKRHHKFVEFFDVRSADAALKALNRTDIAGKRIKVEHSRPGGVRRNMMIQFNPELEQDEFSRGYLNHVDSPLASSPVGNYWCNSPIEKSISKSPIFGSLSNDQGRRVSQLEHLLSSSYNNNKSNIASASFGSASSFGSLNSNLGHVETLSGSEFLWGSPSSVWRMGNSHRYPYSAPHVGSAPSGLFPRSHETSSMGFRGANGNTNAPRDIRGTGSPIFSMLSSPSQFMSNGSYPWHVATKDTNQVDNKQQFQLDLSKIISGEDSRTTLMIKNIPNKYTAKMLLAAIDERNKGTYDFLYLPIDFKNKCSVGYAFINMVSPKFIIGLYEAFNGKKWDKFNSEKVASLAYARIQGKTALIAHFQNSSLLNEDRRCQPIVFDGPESSYPLEASNSTGPRPFVNENTHRS